MPAMKKRMFDSYVVLRMSDLEAAHTVRHGRRVRLYGVSCLPSKGHCGNAPPRTPQDGCCPVALFVYELDSYGRGTGTNFFGGAL